MELENFFFENFVKKLWATERPESLANNLTPTKEEPTQTRLACIIIQQARKKLASRQEDAAAPSSSGFRAFPCVVLSGRRGNVSVY